MPGDTNFSMRMDSALKSQAEEILSELGLTMSGAFTMFLKPQCCGGQGHRDHLLPTSLTAGSVKTLFAKE